MLDIWPRANHQCCCLRMFIIKQYKDLNIKLSLMYWLSLVSLGSLEGWDDRCVHVGGSNFYKHLIRYWRSHYEEWWSLTWFNSQEGACTAWGLNSAYRVAYLCIMHSNIIRRSTSLSGDPVVLLFLPHLLTFLSNAWCYFDFYALFIIIFLTSVNRKCLETPDKFIRTLPNV